jgi:hypothetical protein
MMKIPLVERTGPSEDDRPRGVYALARDGGSAVRLVLRRSQLAKDLNGSSGFGSRRALCGLSSEGFK